MLPARTVLQHRQHFAPQQRARRHQTHLRPRAGLLGSVGAVWDATQRVALSAAVLGLLSAVVTATTPRGRAFLRTSWADFTAREPASSAASAG